MNDTIVFFQVEVSMYESRCNFMWDLVKKMEKKMPSFGGCIVLINTVVANLFMYYLSSRF